MAGRRTFIKKTALGAAAAILAFPPAGRTSSALNLNSYNQKEDEFWRKIRKQFPLTYDRTYFNNGTIGPSPYPVLEAVRTKMDELNTVGEYHGQEISKGPISELVGVSEGEICLTHNTTEGINIVAGGLPIGRGDEIIMTSHEHAGNALPWLNQKKLKGFEIKVFTPADTADENLNRINDLISEKTRVIAIPHITCTTGHVFPVDAITHLAHEKGIWAFYDGAHSAGSMVLDLKAIGCDFYASCGHKWLLGPSGTGFLYVSLDMLDVLQAEFIGAYSDTGWTISEEQQDMKGYVDNAHRYYYGTQSAALSSGLKAAVDFMNEIDMARVETYSKSLANYLREELVTMEGSVQILTPLEEASRSTMISFKISSMDYREFGKLATENKFRIRLVPESGLNAIRISTHIYNNKSEIDRFILMVAGIVKG